MQEKTMVNDVLSGLKSSISNYGRIISECSDQNLRQTIQQIRNNCEQYQYQLYQMAEQKNYYQAAQTASERDISQVRSDIAQGGQ